MSRFSDFFSNLFKRTKPVAIVTAPAPGQASVVVPTPVGPVLVVQHNDTVTALQAPAPEPAQTKVLPPPPPAGNPALDWANDMVAHGAPVATAYAVVKAQWTKDGHTTPFPFALSDMAAPPTITTAGGQSIPLAPAQVQGPVIAYVEKIVPSGAPGTVTLPLTGHVLSLPRPDLGEALIGYAERVYKQCGADSLANLGGLILSQSVPAVCGPATGDPVKDYPVVVDAYYNHAAYLTAAQAAYEQSLRDADSRNATIAATLQPGDVNVTTAGLTVSDMFFIGSGGGGIATVRNPLGLGPQLELNRMINWTKNQGSRPDWVPETFLSGLVALQRDPTTAINSYTGPYKAA
jgi:hypothetical protein